MSEFAYPQGRPARRRVRPGRMLIPAGAVAILLAALPRGGTPEAPRPPEPAPVAALRGEPAPAAPVRTRAGSDLRAPAGQGAQSGSQQVAQTWLLDPTPLLGARTPALAPAAPAPTLAAVLPAASAPAPVQVAARAPEPARVLQRVPLPQRRPLDLAAAPEAPEARPVERLLAQRARLATRQTPRPDARREAQAERSFFETVFGAGEPEEAPRPAAGPALAYAAVEPDVVAPRRRLVEPGVAADGLTAVYDISAGTVTLPSGERLEAHSGYGAMMDDPRYVHVRMRGPTPPGTYDLREREALFHGVRAIRMMPVGGSGAIHGRDGILAHTYMLRQPGASNGCVVFRDYDRFLQAYLRGEVRRMTVVAGAKGGGLPSIARLFGGR